MKLAAALLLAISIFAQSGEYERARKLLSSGHASEAAAIFRELARAQPSSPDLKLNLAIAEFKAGQFDEAAESALSALQLAPDLAPAHLFLGAAHLELANFSAAIPALERAVSLSPQDRNAALMLADAYAGAGRPKEALARYEDVLRQSPANPRVVAGMARACEAAGDNVRAREFWGRLAQLPPSAELHIHLAEESAAALRWPAAADQWRQALTSAPENRKARIGLSWALFRCRDYEGTLDALKPLLAANPIAEVLFLNGAALMNMQMPDQAIALLNRALAKAPEMKEARAALGQALLQTGKPDAAIPHLTTALAADQDGTVHFQLFRAYQRTGRKQEAERALSEYQQFLAGRQNVSATMPVR